MSNFITYNNQELNIGDTVAVYQNIVEGGKSRVQMFEGVLIAIQNREENKTMVVRKIATGGIGVEKIFPVELPSIAKIVVKRRAMVRRSKLYFLRGRVGKDAVKLKEKKVVNEKSATKTAKASKTTTAKAAKTDK
jgi:large subunit ribosomal protein L19